MTKSVNMSSNQQRYFIKVIMQDFNYENCRRDLLKGIKLLKMCVS